MLGRGAGAAAYAVASRCMRPAGGASQAGDGALAGGAGMCGAPITICAKKPLIRVSHTTWLAKTVLETMAWPSMTSISRAVTGKF